MSTLLLLLLLQMPPGMDCRKKMVAFYTGGPNHAAMQQVAPKHLEFLMGLFKKGTLLEAGPIDDDRGMLVFNLEDPAAAEALVKDDPFVKEGVVKYQLAGWRRCVANPE